MGGLVRENQFVENDGEVISTSELSGAQVENNEIRRNGGDGILLEFLSDDNEISKNKIFDNGGDDIELRSADDNVIRNNVIKRNGGQPIEIDADSTGNVVAGNKT